MLTKAQLETAGLPQTKVNHLFFAMTFFVQKFDDREFDELLFTTFFGQSVDKSLSRLDQLALADPHFYSFEYNNQDIIGGGKKTLATRNI